MALKKRGRRWRSKCRRLNDTGATSCHSSWTQPQGCDPCIIQLRQWMKREGFAGCSLEPAHFKNTGRGLRTTKPIHTGDIVISIPKGLLITTETVLDSYLGPLFKSQKPPLTALQILSTFLVCERHIKERSRWYPYINVLPETYTNAAYWHSAEVDILPKPLQSSALEQIDNVSKSFRKLSNFIEILEQRFPEFIGVVTYESYRWAWSSINTRSVYMKQKPCEQVSSHEENHYALAPLLDLFNHTSTAEISASYNPSNHCYEIRTITPYTKYSQVFINYGPHNNHKLLVEYGFMVPNNPHNAVIFDEGDIENVADHFAVRDQQLRLDIIRKNDLHMGLTCSEDGLSWTLMTSLKVLCLEFNQLKQWENILAEDGKTCEKEKVIRMARYLLASAAITLQPVEVKGKETPQTEMLIALRSEQLELMTSSLDALKQIQHPG